MTQLNVVVNQIDLDVISYLQKHRYITDVRTMNVLRDGQPIVTYFLSGWSWTISPAHQRCGQMKRKFTMWQSFDCLQSLLLWQENQCDGDMPRVTDCECPYCI